MFPRILAGLTDKEKTRLAFILKEAIAQGVGYAPRRRMALEDYVEVITHTPDDANEDAAAGRAVLRAFRSTAYVANEMILAELLELPPSAMTQPLAPRASIMLPN